MNHFFLSRLAGDTETEPQIFTKSNIADTINFNSSISLLDGPGLLNSVLVQNGGHTPFNGTFNYVTEFEGKPYYNKNGNVDLFIVYTDNQWGIYNFLITSEPIYFSNENVLYPWNVNTWQTLASTYNPVPTVTKVL